MRSRSKSAPASVRSCLSLSPVTRTLSEEHEFLVAYGHGTRHVLDDAVLELLHIAIAHGAPRVTPRHSNMVFEASYTRNLRPCATLLATLKNAQHSPCKRRGATRRASVVADEQQRVAGEERSQDEILVCFLPAKDTELFQNHCMFLHRCPETCAMQASVSLSQRKKEDGLRPRALSFSENSQLDNEFCLLYTSHRWLKGASPVCGKN